MMTRTHPPQSGPGQQGVALVEVLVAVIVLAVGILGLAGLQVATLKYNHSALSRTQATTLAYEISDAIRANRSNAASYVLNYGEAVTGTAIVDQDRQRWLTRLAAALPAGQGRIALNGDNIVVSVRWDDSRGDEPPQEYSFTFQP